MGVGTSEPSQEHEETERVSERSWGRPSLHTPRRLSRLGARLDHGKPCYSKGLCCFVSLAAGLRSLLLTQLISGQTWCELTGRGGAKML